MRLIRFSLFVAMSMLASIGGGISRAVDFALELLSPFARTLNFSVAPRLALSTPGGDQIDGTTFNQSRHESAVHRRSADRKI